MALRKRDRYGQVLLDEEDIFNLLYQGNISLITIPSELTPDIKLHNKWIRTFDREDIIPEYKPLDISIEEFDKTFQDDWFMPEKYKNLDVKSFLIEKCKSDEERIRVEEEFKLFEKYELIMVLRMLVYLVDFMREHKIVWGVGRGSSVSSYCLFLIGVHKVNSLLYEIPIEEFLKG